MYIGARKGATGGVGGKERGAMKGTCTNTGNLPEGKRGL